MTLMGRFYVNLKCHPIEFQMYTLRPYLLTETLIRKFLLAKKERMTKMESVKPISDAHFDLISCKIKEQERNRTKNHLYGRVHTC